MRGLIVVGLVVAVLACAMMISMRPPGSREAHARSSAADPTVRDTTHEAARIVRLYFASPGGDSLAAEARELTSRPGLHERGESLDRERARGSRNGGARLRAPGTAVPREDREHRRRLARTPL